MGVIQVNTVSIDDLEEATSLNENGSVIVFRGNEAKRTSLKVLRQKVNPSPTLLITAPDNTKLTLSNDEFTFEETGANVTFNVPNYGNWLLTAELNGQTKTQTIWIDTVKIYRLTITF